MSRGSGEITQLPSLSTGCLRVPPRLLMDTCAMIGDRQAAWSVEEVKNLQIRFHMRLLNDIDFAVAKLPQQKYSYFCVFNVLQW
jgi:hypothetical protein